MSSEIPPPGSTKPEGSPFEEATEARLLKSEEIREATDSLNEYKAKKYPLTIIPPSEIVTAKDAEKIQDIRDRLSGRNRSEEIPISPLLNERIEGEESESTPEEHSAIVVSAAKHKKGTGSSTTAAGKGPSIAKTADSHAAGHGDSKWGKAGLIFGWLFKIFFQGLREMGTGGTKGGKGGGGHAAKPKAAAGGHH